MFRTGGAGEDFVSSMMASFGEERVRGQSHPQLGSRRKRMS